jgi:hypothetical protein
MIPTKQTVYLPVSENIIFHTENFKKQEGYFFTPEQLNEYTANVVRQALETAAEKVELVPHDVDIDLESITNTFEETFKLYQV